MDLNLFKAFLEMLEERYGAIGKYFGHILMWSVGIAILLYAWKFIKDALKDFGVIPLPQMPWPSISFYVLPDSYIAILPRAIIYGLSVVILLKILQLLFNFIYRTKPMSPLRLSQKAIRRIEPTIYNHPSSKQAGADNHEDILTLTNASKTESIYGIEVELLVCDFNGTPVHRSMPGPLKINLDENYIKMINLKPGGQKSFKIMEYRRSPGDGVVYINDGDSEGRHSILPIEVLSDYQLKVTVTAEDVPPLVCLYEIECSKQKGILWKSFTQSAS